MPRLCHFSDVSGSRSVSGSVLWKRAGQSTLSGIGLIGPVEAIWPASGEVQWRSRVVLLGEASAMLAEPADSPDRGKLRFEAWKLAGVVSKTEAVTVTSQINGDCLLAKFEYLGTGAPPEYVEAELLWRGNPIPAKVRLPVGHGASTQKGDSSRTRRLFPSKTCLEFVS
jgi:hypothetical protein